MIDKRLDKIYSINQKKISSRQIKGSLILLDKEKGTFFTLNSTGVRIWQSIKAGKSLAGIIKDVIEKFEVEEDEAKEKVFSFVTLLTRQGFILSKMSK